MRAWRQGWDDYRFVAEDFIAVGDQVVVFFRETVAAKKAGSAAS